jgi:hypothetical protein
MKDDFRILFSDVASCRIPAYFAQNRGGVGWFIGKCSVVAAKNDYKFSNFMQGDFFVISDEKARLVVTVEHKHGADVVFLTVQSDTESWEILGAFWELLKAKGLVVYGEEEERIYKIYLGLSPLAKECFVAVSSGLMVEKMKTRLVYSGALDGSIRNCISEIYSAIGASSLRKDGEKKMEFERVASICRSRLKGEIEKFRKSN